MENVETPSTASDAVRSLGWRPGRVDDPIEVITRASLFDRFGASHLGVYERLDFHLVQIVNAGRCRHEVDFDTVELHTGRALHVEPGQVHRWLDDGDADATLVLFRELPSGLRPSWSLGPRTIELSAVRGASIESVIGLVGAVAGSAPDAAGRSTALRAVRDLLVVALGLTDESTLPAAGRNPTFVAYHRDLEEYLDATQGVEQRAARLGWSARTITRACLDATGRTAKQLADERLALEARRLLSQPGATAAATASALGFSEATNFAKFFRRVVGVRPSEWRAGVTKGPVESPSPS